MKKTIIISVIAILFVVLIGWWRFGDAIKRTPDYVLRIAVENDFGINMDEISPTVTHFEEQWCPNGDGDCCIQFKYKRGEYSAFFMQLEPFLNIKEIPHDVYVSKYFEDTQQGYYKYTQDAVSPDNFKILVIDPQEHKGGTLLSSYVISLI